MNISHINNAYENIKSTCENRLNELYPHKIPKAAMDRLEKELEYLQNSDYIDDFEIARLLYEESRKSSQYLITRGTLSGSYIFHLISTSLTNPLPPHYICPNCGETKIIDSKLFGIDYPERKCPVCNSPMISDGYNISVESVWGNDGKKSISFDYNTSREFYPFVKRLLQRIYPENSIVPYGMLYVSETQSSVDMNLCGYIILSKGQTIDDYPDLQGYLENGELCISGNLMDIEENNMKRILLYDSNVLNAIVSMQRCTGIYISSITPHELQDITWKNIANVNIIEPEFFSKLKYIKPQTKTELINLMCSFHSTYSCCPVDPVKKSPDWEKMLNSPEFRKYPCYSRDDVFDILLSLDFPRNKAFETSELIRKGKAFWPKYHDIFEPLNIPDDLFDVFKTIHYLFPRAHSCEYILTYSILAYYLKTDSKSYSKIIKQFI
ncbi:MAG: hypothetical protein K6E10_03310 [Eubacterium sp.]|nr:hypothetical protein [Eubacterium sp.]